jgi:beta-glucanase (GH16 family)
MRDGLPKARFPNPPYRTRAILFRLPEKVAAIFLLQLSALTSLRHTINSTFPKFCLDPGIPGVLSTKSIFYREKAMQSGNAIFCRWGRPVTIRIDSRFTWRCTFILAIVFLSLTGAGRANAQGCTGVLSATIGAVTWTPQWCQEFNSTIPGPPDITVWNFDLGNSGFGNHEIEVYCGPPGYPKNPSQCPSTFSPSTSNAYLDGNGHLLIQVLNTGGPTAGTWTSGRLNTAGHKDFQYGWIEARIQLPDTTNQGLWPAFWSLGSIITTTPSCWPACGEADMMEVWSPQVLGGPGPLGNRATIHTASTGASGLQPNGKYTFTTGANNTALHTYGVIWSANMMQYYVDNPTTPFYITTASDLSASDTWPFNAKLFLIMNVAVGGTLGGTPTPSTPNPGIMTVDYVRQYQPSAAPVPVLGNPPSITVKAGATTGNSSTFTPGLTPNPGYVYFSCSTNAPKASCSIATNDPLNSHIVNSFGSENVTVSVATTANSVLPPYWFDPKPWLLLPMAFAATLLLAILSLAQRLRSRAWRPAYAMLALLILAGITIAACGGGSSMTPPPPPINGTTPGAYTVTVYAFTESNASDGTNANADAKVAIPLTVN